MTGLRALAVNLAGWLKQSKGAEAPGKPSNLIKL
jgi:hypothetical protein